MEWLVSLGLIVSIIAGGIKLTVNHFEKKKERQFEAAKIMCEKENDCTDLKRFTKPVKKKKDKKVEPEEEIEPEPDRKITPVTEIEDLE